MKTKEKKDYGDVLIDSFEYAVLHAGAIGGGVKLRRSRGRLASYIAALEASVESWKKRARGGR